MRKVFVLALMMSIIVSAQAGYVIRGIQVPNFLYDDLQNYTLTFTPDGVPVAAASMHSSFFGSGTGKNIIVIIREDISGVSCIYRYKWDNPVESYGTLHSPPAKTIKV